MSTALTEQMKDVSPRCKARVAGAFYLLTFITGISALFLRGTPGLVVGLSMGVCYVTVTLLFYFLFKPVNRRLSLLAAFISLAGTVMGPLNRLHLLPFRIHSLVFFGVYCLLLGYLIYKSTFLPSPLGALMALAGLGWLTFFSPSLGGGLVPYIYVPGTIGEGALTLWLLALAVNEQRWNEQAGLMGRSL